MVLVLIWVLVLVLVSLAIGGIPAKFPNMTSKFRRFYVEPSIRSDVGSFEADKLLWDWLILYKP